MNIFKTVIKILRKHLPYGSVYVIVFLVIAIMAATLDGGNNIFEKTRLNICIYDEDKTPASEALCEYIGGENNIVSIKNDRDSLTDALYYSEIDYALTVKSGYSEKLSSEEPGKLFEIRRMHEGYSEALMDMELEKYVSTVRAYLNLTDTQAEAVRSAEKALSDKAEVNTVNFKNTDGFSLSCSVYFQYLAYILPSVMMSVLTPVLVTLDKKGVRMRTDCSSVTPLSFTLQTVAASAVFVAVIWLLFMVFGAVIYGEMYQGIAWLAVLNSFIFALVSTSIAIFISCFSPEGSMLTFIIQVVGMGMSFLCGVFVDQSLLSGKVLAAAKFMPAYWYVRANSMICNGTAFDAGETACCFMIELAFAVVPILLSLVIRRSRYVAFGRVTKKSAF